MAEQAEFRLVAGSTKFAQDTNRGRGEAAELADDLWAQANRSGVKPADVRGGSPDDPQMKGDPITIGAIVIALINAGALTAVVGCFRDWLGRKPTERELRVDGRVGDEVIDITVTASNIDSADVRAALEAALEAGSGG